MVVRESYLLLPMVLVYVWLSVCFATVMCVLEVFGRMDHDAPDYGEKGICEEGQAQAQGPID